MPKGKATIDYDGYELLIRFDPYRPDIVEEIKVSIPQHSRTFDPAEKAWRVSFLYLDHVCDLFEVYDYAVRDFTGDDAASKLRQSGERAKRDERLAKLDAKARAAEAARTRRAKAESAREHEAQQAREADQEREAAEMRRFRASFRIAWPELQEKHFLMWWNLYKQYGREKANILFNAAYARANEGARRAHQESQYFYRPEPKKVDYYTILGIVSTCSQEEAKTAYRQMAMKYHPDRNPGDAAALEMMKKVNMAWDTINTERGWK